MKRFLKNKNQVFIVIGIFCLLVICYAFFRHYTNNYNYLKINKKEYLVYTSSQEQSGSYYQYKPYVNLKGEVGSVINQDIEQYLSNFTQENICITYETDLSGKVLSLVIKVEDYSYAESAAVMYFRSYNIHLGTLEILDNNTLFQYYGISSDEVSSILDSMIQNYYNQLVEEGYINQRNCNYQCFLKSRNFEEGMNDVEFYVRDGSLIAFKPYVSMQGESVEEDILDFVIVS